jgi:hypothetical protein
MSDYKKWYWYIPMVVMPLAGLAICKWINWEPGMWFFGIVAASGIGSVYATEITFWQIKHRRGGIVQEIINELTSHPKVQQFLDSFKSKNFLEAWDELRGLIKDARETFKGYSGDIKEILEFLHEFAERRKALKQERNILDADS